MAAQIRRIVAELQSLPLPSSIDSLDVQDAWRELDNTLLDISTDIQTVYPRQYTVRPQTLSQKKDHLKLLLHVPSLLPNSLTTPISMQQLFFHIGAPMDDWRHPAHNDEAFRRLGRGYVFSPEDTKMAVMRPDLANTAHAVRPLCEEWRHVTSVREEIARLAAQYRLVMRHSSEHTTHNYVMNVLAMTNFIRFARDVDSSGPIDDFLLKKLVALEWPGLDEEDACEELLEAVMDLHKEVQGVLRLAVLVHELYLSFGTAVLIDPAFHLRPLLSGDTSTLHVIIPSLTLLAPCFAEGEYRSRRALSEVVLFLAPTPQDRAAALGHLHEFWKDAGHGRLQ
ncbi:hypothetical protein C8R47DRAFT_1158164 [Mycena vitilis]|nr:hypothetical protein C8R47DRAFT_1158164 [Mycena vitilis]